MLLNSLSVDEQIILKNNFKLFLNFACGKDR